MKVTIEDNVMTIFLKGRIDTNNALQTENELFSVVKSAPEAVDQFILDSSELEYISSAGLRVLMKMRKNFGENIRVIGVSPEVYDVFDVTGFTEILKVEKRYREISVEGCEVIGTGFYGTVYRVDPETIVKVYQTPDSLPIIQNEQKLAKRAFVNGVPTAISYDIVKVGDMYGSVFELLNADTFNDLLIREPERFDEILRIYADFLKTVHSAEMDDDTLPMARDIFIGYFDVISDYLPEEQCIRLKELILALPYDHHVVHGDFQMKNVMLVGDEPMLIDMDTLCTGQPLFDLQALYVTYILFSEDDPENLEKFLGIRNDWGEPIWKSIMENYFGRDMSELAEVNDKIVLTAAVRFLYLIASTELKEGELGENRIKTAQRHITELIDKVNDLNL
ncbi:MAG: anti-sigma factor antagonist [Ruminococcus sp.]|nr:anti-sigma factor antagonist [Ruminococcus sp.]